MPLIKTKTALAFEIPFLDARNKHTTTGNKNKTTKPSYLNCVKMLANAPKILETSTDEMLSSEVVSNVKTSKGSGSICMYIRTKPMAMIAKYDDSDKIFFLLGKSDNAIKGKIIGSNPIDSGCESTEEVKEIGDKGQLLKTKYIASR